jgi:hypothetical protein
MRNVQTYSICFSNLQEKIPDGRGGIKMEFTEIGCDVGTGSTAQRTR